VDAALLGQIASQGVLGVVAIALGWAYLKKDKELADERAARISDAKGYTDLALKLQQQVLDTSNRLADTFDEMRRANQGRTTVR
jgi:hypothetical protein